MPPVRDESFMKTMKEEPAATGGQSFLAAFRAGPPEFSGRASIDARKGGDIGVGDGTMSRREHRRDDCEQLGGLRSRETA